MQIPKIRWGITYFMSLFNYMGTNSQEKMFRLNFVCVIKYVKICYTSLNRSICQQFYELPSITVVPCCPVCVLFFYLLVVGNWPLINLQRLSCHRRIKCSPGKITHCKMVGEKGFPGLTILSDSDIKDTRTLSHRISIIKISRNFSMIR